jgi:DNA-binding CsgD family transcriptional regulator
MTTIIQLDESFYRSHVTFKSVPLITEITKPLTNIGLSYFTFDRTYQDGSHLRLTNAGKWIESYYRSELYKAAIFEKDPRLFRNGFVFWSWLNREPVYSAAAEHDIDHGLTIIERHEQYADFFHFGTTRSNFISPEDLVAKIDFLYRFIAFFKQKLRHLIITAENTRLLLPVNQDKQIELSELQQHRNTGQLSELLKKTEVSRLYLGEDFDNAYLTRREIDILWLLTEGKKPIEISKRLGLSNRTLETHVKNIKDKFKCDTLFELGFTLGALGVQNLYPFKIQLPDTT